MFYTLLIFVGPLLWAVLRVYYPSNKGHTANYIYFFVFGLLPLAASVFTDLYNSLHGISVENWSYIITVPMFVFAIFFLGIVELISAAKKKNISEQKSPKKNPNK